MADEELKKEEESKPKTKKESTKKLIQMKLSDVFNAHVEERAKHYGMPKTQYIQYLIMKDLEG